MFGVLTLLKFRHKIGVCWIELGNLNQDKIVEDEWLPVIMHNIACEVEPVVVAAGAYYYSFVFCICNVNNQNCSSARGFLNPLMMMMMMRPVNRIKKRNSL